MKTAALLAMLLSGCHAALLAFGIASAVGETTVAVLHAKREITSAFEEEERKHYYEQLEREQREKGWRH